MKRILFFIESLSGGGAERVLVTFLKHIDYKYYNVSLLTLVDGGVLNDEIKDLPISHKSVIQFSSKKLIRFWNRFKYKLIYAWLPIKLVNRWIIPQKGFDVYVAFTEGFSTKLLSYSPKKKIAWVHIDLKTYPWTIKEHIYKGLQEEIESYNKYDRVICVSHSVENIMKDYYCLSNTTTIYNPIDTEYIIRKSLIHYDYTISTGFNIVSVGRLVPQKGYDELIPIIANLRKEGFDVHLYLIGEGLDRNILEELVKINNLEGFVHLLGYLNNPFPLMKMMNLFVCSSRAEGFSLVIAEAMLLGLPIVSMDCSGPNELLDNGKYGILCDNYADLTIAIKRVIDSQPFRQVLCQKAKERSSQFQINNSILSMYKEFES